MWGSGLEGLGLFVNLSSQRGQGNQKKKSKLKNILQDAMLSVFHLNVVHLFFTFALTLHVYIKRYCKKI